MSGLLSSSARLGLTIPKRSLYRLPCSSTLSCLKLSSSRSLPYASAVTVLRKQSSSALPRDGASATLAPYKPPATGLLSKLPKSWIPYAELIRLDKPAGSIYLFFPCLFGTLLASCYTLASPVTMLGTSALFGAGAIIMRGAGCTINDIWDRNLDPQVSRTRLRPIARRAISVPRAIVFTGFQLAAGLAILLQFPAACFWYATPSLALVATYPLAKRVTNYPQAVLGLAFSWGALVSFPALSVDLMSPEHIEAAKAVCLLYSSCVSWTILYDMIYAHMDVKDDVKAGIKSIALRHLKDTKTVLSGLGVVQVGLLASVGAVLGLGPGYYFMSCGGAAATLGIMIRKVRLEERSSCWWWFSKGVWFTGGAISLGLLEEYVERKWKESDRLASQEKKEMEALR